MKMKGEIVCCVGNFTEDLLKQKVLVQTKRKKTKSAVVYQAPHLT